jgi:hypothetical protein
VAAALSAFVAVSCKDDGNSNPAEPDNPSVGPNTKQQTLKPTADVSASITLPLKAVPFEFVGGAGACGSGYPAGAKIVTSKWLIGLGLPDNGGPAQNTSDPRDPPSKINNRQGLLLSKNGPSPVCASAGATIQGVDGMKVETDTDLGFDYRNGGHCSGGGPRFNLTYRAPGASTNSFAFIGGCGNDPAPQPAPQDPTEWTRVRFNLVAAGIPLDSRIRQLELILDEGTDTPTPGSGNVGGIGLAVVDNIAIDGQTIRKGP